MLPFHGRDAYDGDKIKRGSRRPLVAIVVGLLAVALIFTGWGAWSSRAAVSKLKQDLAKLTAEVSAAQDDLNQATEIYRHVENAYQAMNRQVVEKTRQVRLKEHELQQDVSQRSAKQTECQRKLDDGYNQLTYEGEVNEALKKHVHKLEDVHKAREADWHGLAEQWRKYEIETVEENHRLILEIGKLKHLEAQAKFDDPVMPVIEPEVRPETRFETDFTLPQYRQGQQQAARQIQQQQPSQAVPQQQQQQQQQPQQQPQQQQPVHSQPVHSQPVHSQPPAQPTGLRHHDDIYTHHYEDPPAWGAEDPLDHYWMHDQFADNHDNFHGSNWHGHPSPSLQAHHDDHWQQDHAQQHGQWQGHEPDQWQHHDDSWSTHGHADHGAHHYDDWHSAGHHDHAWNEHDQWQGQQHGTPDHGAHGAQWQDDSWKAASQQQAPNHGHQDHGQQHNDWNNEWHAPEHGGHRDHQQHYQGHNDQQQHYQGHNDHWSEPPRQPEQDQWNVRQGHQRQK